MRKSAPALILTTLVALASGSAMALGDRAKERKANTDAATATTSAGAAASGATANPSGPGAPNTTSGMSSAPNNPGAGSITSGASTPGASASASSDASTSAGKPDKVDAKKNKDGKCDEAKYPSKSAMPPECLEKTSPGGASAGPSGGAGSGSAGSTK